MRSIFSNHQTKISIALSIALLSHIFAGPAQAFRGSIGAIASEKKLSKGSKEGDDLTFSPMLLDMAKVIGRSGLPAGFFLQNDSAFPDQPGIDLRSLLLYQAGLLKVPKLTTTGRQPNSEGAPTLAAPAIPDLGGTLGEQPKPAEELPRLQSVPLPGDTVEPQVMSSEQAELGRPEKISLRGPAQSLDLGPAPMILFDGNRFLSELSEQDQTTSDLPQLAVAMPRTPSMPFVTKTLFRLWTYRPDKEPAAAATPQIAFDKEHYEGTFVVATTGVIKSITGRSIRLSPGRLLARNEGAELKFQTDFGEVMMDPETTAILELTDKGLLRIIALETDGDHAVTVKLFGDQDKFKMFNLKKGEEMLMADHAISAEDLKVSHGAAKDKENPQIAQGKYQMGQVMEKESLLRTDNSEPNRERHSAISELIRRLSQLEPSL